MSIVGKTALVGAALAAVSAGFAAPAFAAHGKDPGVLFSKVSAKPGERVDFQMVCGAGYHYTGVEAHNGNPFTRDLAGMGSAGGATVRADAKPGEYGFTITCSPNKAGDPDHPNDAPASSVLVVQAADKKQEASPAPDARGQACNSGKTNCGIKDQNKKPGSNSAGGNVTGGGKAAGGSYAGRGSHLAGGSHLVGGGHAASGGQVVTKPRGGAQTGGGGTAAVLVP